MSVRTFDVMFTSHFMQEEKKLRKKLNLKVSTTMPHGMTLTKKGENGSGE